jgi:hypothetical protein
VVNGGKKSKWRTVSLDKPTEEQNVFYVTDGNIMYLTDASRFLISCVIQHYASVVGWGGGGQMHNVDYDPGPWRQTLRLPPPGIEPGGHAS